MGENMMKLLKPVSGNCGGDIERLITPQKDRAGTQHKSGGTLTKAIYLPYGWVRNPAILLGCIGVLGILIHRVGSIAAVFSFLNMPPEAMCYLITIGASILFGISMICEKSEKEIGPATTVPLQIEQNWRSV
jgi:hypothetical protein